MIDQAQLAESLGRLDAGTRALLDLSLRRAIPDDQVAKVLGVDATSIPPRRARGIAQLADMMEVPGPAELAALLIAIPDLPEDAWGVPAPVPFAGGLSRARRAKAFRRVAVAASPLVALGAVMAAVLVSSDHSGGGPGSGTTQRAAGGADASGDSAAATAAAPDARHALPAGVQLTLVHPGSARRGGHAARHHRARRTPGAGQAAILARHRAESAPRNVPVSFQPAPVVHNQPVVNDEPVVPNEPRHVTHRHTPAKPKTPKSTPAPVQTPSQPVSNPAPTTPASPPIQISAPVTHTVGSTPTLPKPTKTPPPQPNVSEGEGEGEGEGGGCGHHGGDDRSDDDGSGDHGRRHGDSSQGQSAGGKPFTPPGLFRKHHGH